MSYLMEATLIIFGSILTGFGAIILMYFKDMKLNIKTMSESMITMNLKLTEVITKHGNTEYVARNNTEEIGRVRDRLHKVEGSSSQVLQFIKEMP
jgi:flavodoxin